MFTKGNAIVIVRRGWLEGWICSIVGDLDLGLIILRIGLKTDVAIFLIMLLPII